MLVAAGTEAVSSGLSPVSIVIGLCVGALAATVATLLLCGLSILYLRRKYKMPSTRKGKDGQ